MEPRPGHGSARLEVERRGGLEDEASRVAEGIVAHAGEPLSVSVRSVAPLALQKQERPETPPSTTTMPGEVPADPEAEEEKKTATMWEKVGTELAKEALKQFGKIPGVAEVYKAIENFFDLTAVQIVGGLGYTATAATMIVVNAMEMQARTEPGAVPPEETMFGVKGTWDFTSAPKDIKVLTPIGDLPPSFGEEKPATGGSTKLAVKPSSVPEDPIGKKLREAKEEQFVMNWVLSRQDEILNPVKESRKKPARRKKKPRARRKPPRAPERRRREEEWPSFKRRSEGAAPAHDEPEVADAGRRTPGRPLDPEMRDRMERGLGCDFGRVRVHADAASAAAAEALNARAYTVGRDVVFGAGEYRPATAEGLRLLAHELTHVVQQGGAQPVREPSDGALRRVPPSSLTGPSPAAPRTGPSAIAGAHRAEPAPPAPLLQRKCACGGSAGLTGECADCRRKRVPGRLQTKLAVNGPGDPFEREADRVAEQITRIPASPPDLDGQSGPARANLQRQVSSEGGGLAEAPPIVTEALRSSGQAMDSSTRAFFEDRFGHDFSQVRIHSDSLAADSARAVNALAYTVGSHVAFDRGRYAPTSSEGRRLLAHELAHVVQQAGGDGIPSPLLQRQGKGTARPKCGEHFRYEFDGVINDERPEAHRGVPRMYYADVGQAEAERKPGEPPGKGKVKRKPIEPLTTGTGVEVGQLDRLNPLWRAVCYKAKGMPWQIMWVLDEYISRKGEPKKEAEKKTVPSQKCAWPPIDPTPLPAPDAATEMLTGTQVLSVLVDSYKEHTKDNRYLDNAFWGSDPADTSTWPCTLWDALKKITYRIFFKAIFKVAARTQSFPDLWSKIRRVKNCWDEASNHGFEFDTLGDDEALRNALKKSDAFCRDFPLTESIYHKGQDCWREITGAGEGLHFCLGKGLSPNVHIDLTQPASGKLLGYCQYDPSALKKHGEDVSKED
jgi:hypothetical protein